MVCLLIYTKNTFKMSFRTKNIFLTLILISFLKLEIKAQPVPPSQIYVNYPGDKVLLAPAISNFCPSANFTIEAWCYLPVVSPYGWIMGKSIGSGSNPGDPYYSYCVNFDGTGLNPTFICSTGAVGSFRQITSSISLKIGQWTHIAAVLDGNNMQLYINGVLAASGTASGSVPVNANMHFSLGSAYNLDGSSNSTSFLGYLRDVRFWSVSRTQTQLIESLHSYIISSNQGLIAEWPLDEASGSYCRDISGNGFNLTTSSGLIHSDLVTFTNILPLYSVTKLNLNDNSMSYPNWWCILLDYNNDGYTDLLVTQSNSPNYPDTYTPLKLFKNTKGVFQDSTNTDLGSVSMVDPRAWAVADFNNDGLQDVVVVGSGTDMPPFLGEQPRLLNQTNKGILKDVTSLNFPSDIQFIHSVAVGDIRKSGSNDIFVGTLGITPSINQPRFYINDGNGNFTISLDRLPTNLDAHTSSYLLDVNNDGYPDLILGASSFNSNGGPGLNQILINNGKGYFYSDSKWVLPQKLIDTTSSVIDIASADLNGDGRKDLILSTTGGSIPSNFGGTLYGYQKAAIQILLANTDGTFYDASVNSGISLGSNIGAVYKVFPVDVNGDGFIDLVTLQNTSIGIRGSIFLNKGNGTFIEATDLIPPVNDGFNVGDFNNDGIADFVSASPNTITTFLGIKKFSIDVYDPLKSAQLIGSAPNITSQPTAVSIKSGSSATLSVTATGTGTIQYQWQKNRINIANAYSSSYTIPAAQLSDGGIYSVLVGNAGGTTVSNYVPLSVTATGSPTITINPSSQTITSGSTVVFKAAASSTTTATYQWYLNGVAITGATSSTLLIPGATSANVGTYNCTFTNSAGSVTTTSAQLTLLTTTNPGRLVNLSVLTMDGPGSQMLTLGFVNGGAGTTGSEPLLIRASGPALTAFNVPTVLADPALTLFQGSNAVVTNDNWGSSASNVTAVNAAEAATGAFQLTPITSLDAAVVQTLPSVQGGYTVQVQGNNNGVGNAMAEVYDNTTNYTSTSPRLVNLSCRQLVPANGTLTAGFVISGTTSKTVLIRASGPTLASYNVPGTMTDPQISVFSGATVIASNAGWAGDTAIATAAANVGAFPYASNTSKDSAVLMTLAPGSYTVQATSVSGTAGVTLIEVYEVP